MSVGAIQVVVSLLCFFVLWIPFHCMNIFTLSAVDGHLGCCLSFYYAVYEYFVFFFGSTLICYFFRSIF